jgi:hypothetical protein
MTGIARSTFYHASHRETLQLKSDLELRSAIEHIHIEQPGYGYRRVRNQLLRDGKVVNSKRIRRVMKKYRIFSCVKKMFKQRGSNTGVKLVYPNLVRGIKLCPVRATLAQNGPEFKSTCGLKATVPAPSVFFSVHPLSV